ncbi:GNAT family N-acetyltransferase [Myroides fluvii]|uniref:GNAT family N-acetyltransferase n=1 Tax=Myroides fluvii TaxID=2572594 RepID=UPI00131BDA5F|nr:GNAT family N-acetyltransferase [Myroides fluvii]
MRIIELSQVDKKEIVQVLNASFADYIIPLQLNVEQLEMKITAENIQLNLSVGVLDQGKLVGFMLHALNPVDGKLTAYNAATGVIPSHRGQGLVAKMYDWLLEQLAPLQVEQLVLEVIEGNNSAIRAYEKMGYHKARKLICFEGETVVTNQQDTVDIKELADYNWPVFTQFWAIQPAWQNAIAALENSKSRCRILGAYKAEQLVGYLIFNPTSKRVLQLAVDANQRRQGIATQLIQAMQQITASKALYVYNIDDASVELAAFFSQLKLTSDLAQFEMKRTR